MIMFLYEWLLKEANKVICVRTDHTMGNLIGTCHLISLFGIHQFDNWLQLKQIRIQFIPLCKDEKDLIFFAVHSSTQDLFLAHRKGVIQLLRGHNFWTTYLPLYWTFST